MSSPYLHALSCSKCGAPLQGQSGQSILNCSYCGTSHAFVSPPPPEPPGADYQPGEAVAVEWGGVWWPARVVRSTGPGRWLINYSDWDTKWDEEVDRSRIRHRTAATARRPSSNRVPALLAMALGGLVVLATVIFFVLARAPAQQAAAAPDYTAGASYQQGEAVEVWWQASWYDGHVESVEGNGEYEVSYDGWSSSWNETVTNRRLKKKAPAAVATATSASDDTADDDTASDDTASNDTPAERPATRGGSYQKGQAVMIEWHGSWYPGTILEVVGKRRYLIHYDGYSASWDEAVGPARLKPR